MALTLSKQTDPLYFDLHVEISQNGGHKEGASQGLNQAPSQGEVERSYHLYAVQHPPAPSRGKQKREVPVGSMLACEHTFVSWEELLSALRGICPLGDLEVLHSMILRRNKVKIGSFHLQPSDLDVLGLSPAPEPTAALI